MWPSIYIAIYRRLITQVKKLLSISLKNALYLINAWLLPGERSWRTFLKKWPCYQQPIITPRNLIHNHVESCQQGILNIHGFWHDTPDEQIPWMNYHYHYHTCARGILISFTTCSFPGAIITRGISHPLPWLKLKVPSALQAYERRCLCISTLQWVWWHMKYNKFFHVFYCSLKIKVRQVQRS